MAVAQPQADLPRSEFGSGRGGAELFGAEGIVNADLFASPPAATGVTLGWWNGSAYVQKPLKRWNGTAYVEVTLKRWDGATYSQV